MRPCKCGKCRLCWLVKHRPEYAAKFGEPAPTEVLPLAGSRPARLHLRMVCEHMGNRLEVCHTCNDDSRHVYECDLHGRCTRGIVSDKVRSCLTCPDWQLPELR